MSLALIPDCERLIGSWLRDHPDIEALQAKVAGTVPSDTKLPFVRVTQLDDRAVDEISDRLIEYMVQLDCYAGSTAQLNHQGQAEASTLSRTVRAALLDMVGVRDGATVTGVRFVSNPRVPDAAFEPARERFIRTVIVWAHP